MKIPSRLRPFFRRAVRAAGYVVVGGVGALHRLFQRPYSRRLSQPVRRILVIRLDLLGDLVFSMPAVEGVRTAYPHARLTLLTLPYTAPLARGYASVDEVVSVDTNLIRSLTGLLRVETWRGYWSVYRHLRSQQFDLCLSLNGRMASLWAFLSGAQRVVGYAHEAYPFMLNDPVHGGRYDRREHEVEFNRRLAGYVGALSGPRALAVPIPAGAERRADDLLARYGISPEDRVVVVHAGSINGSAKRWPAAHWSGFVDAVYDRTGARVVLVGAASDRPVADEVTQAADTPVVSFAGETSLHDLVVLLKRANVVCSGDSGPLHLAVALERPLVALYGPTDPRIYGPYQPTAPTTALRVDLPCSPCYPMSGSGECPLGDPICMRLLTVESAVQATILQLDRQSQPAANTSF